MVGVLMPTRGEERIAIVLHLGKIGGFKQVLVRCWDSLRNMMTDRNPRNTGQDRAKNNAIELAICMGH